MPVERARKGERIVGTLFRFVRNPGAARIARHAGLDFIMLDMEHAPYSLETVADFCKVARTIGLGCFVRVPELARGYVSRTLDSGVTGVMVPMLESVQQANRLVAWSKYAPLGDRGLGGSGGHTDFAGIAGRAKQFMAEANNDVLSIAQIETAKAVESIEEIAAVDGIDALLIGPNDLSISLGCAGELTHPDVDRAIEKVARVAAENKKVFGMHAGDALLDKWIPYGLSLIMNRIDIDILASGIAAISEKYKAP